MSSRSFRGWIVAGLAFAAASFGGYVLVLRSGGEPTAAGGPPTARLISAQQYVNVMRDLFGEDIRVEVNFDLPRRGGLLALGATEIGMTPGLFSQFDRSAQSVARQMVSEERRDLLIPCQPDKVTAPDDACAAKFLDHVGRLLFRRPLTDEQRKLYVAAAHRAAEGAGNFYTGLAHSLSAMMVSPHFLYFMERSEPDPDRKDHVRLDAYAKAERLSLFLWNSTPDDVLLASAEAGKLHRPSELKAQAARMLADQPRLERGTRDFFGDMLLFERFATLTKDPVIYPAFTSDAITASKEQAYRLIVDHLLIRQADYRDLFTTNRTFVNADLAPLLRMPVDQPTWMPATLDAGDSAGLLTAPGFLAMHSHAGRSSPTLRGRAVREALLCQTVPEPPGDVDFTAFDASFKTVKTTRERLLAHATNPTCAGCHKITDPIGLGLENYDGAAQFRTAEEGASIDASGDLDGTQFANAAELGRAVHDNPALTSCLVNRLFTYGVSRKPEHEDQPYLTYVGRRFADTGYSYPELLKALVLSDAFYAVTPPDVEQTPTPQGR